MGLNEKFFASAAADIAGLVLYYNNSRNSTTWIDLSTAGNDGTVNGPTWNNAGYYEFDGSNDWVNSNYTLPSGSDDFSVETWFEYNSSSGIRGIWATEKNSGSDRLGIHLFIQSSRLIINSFDSSGVSDLFGNTIISNGWNHSVVTYEGGLTKLYVNGTLQNTTINAAITSHFGTIGIGLYYRSLTSNASTFLGNISKVRAYESVLTQSEVTDLYNEGQ